MNNENILNGKLEAEKIFLDLKKQIAKLKFKPTLAVILVGNDPASKIYVGIKEKRAKELGVVFQKHLLSESITEKKLINLIQKLNVDKKITGILLQLPLPKKFKANKIIANITTEKDVDGLNSDKRQATSDKIIVSPTIQSIIHLIKLPKQKLTGKKAVILCHNKEFALPLQSELKRKSIKTETVLCSDFKKHNSLFFINYSIVIVALGKKYFIKTEMIKKNALIIDVGINRVGKKIFGDVDPACLTKTKYISPVPGGVGPLTVAYLFKNLLRLI